MVINIQESEKSKLLLNNSITDEYKHTDTVGVFCDTFSDTFIRNLRSALKAGAVIVRKKNGELEQIISDELTNFEYTDKDIGGLIVSLKKSPNLYVKQEVLTFGDEKVINKNFYIKLYNIEYMFDNSLPYKDQTLFELLKPSEQRHLNDVNSIDVRFKKQTYFKNRKNKVFNISDITRLKLTDVEICKYFCNYTDGRIFMEHGKKYLSFKGVENNFVKVIQIE
jgi:hypothetical protein